MFPNAEELEHYRNLPWHSRTLFYGPPAGGKTAIGASAFWNWETGQQIAEGRLLAIGGEYNEALGIPENLIRRFKSPSLGDNKWLTELTAYTTALIKDAYAGKLGLDVIVFDGFTEFDKLFEGVADNKGTAKFDKFDGLLSELFACISRLDPEVLGCDVLATARVQEKRKAKQSQTGTTITGDAGWVNDEYYPAMRGGMKYDLPHYFRNVFYMEMEDALLPGKAKKQRMHALNMLSTGDFLVKNQWEHLWLPAKLPSTLYNVTWPELKLMLDKLRHKQLVGAKVPVEEGADA